MYLLHDKLVIFLVTTNNNKKIYQESNIKFANVLGTKKITSTKNKIMILLETQNKIKSPFIDKDSITTINTKTWQESRMKMMLLHSSFIKPCFLF